MKNEQHPDHSNAPLPAHLKTLLDLENESRTPSLWRMIRVYLLPVLLLGFLGWSSYFHPLPAKSIDSLLVMLVVLSLHASQELRSHRRWALLVGLLHHYQHSLSSLQKERDKAERRPEE